MSQCGRAALDAAADLRQVLCRETVPSRRSVSTLSTVSEIGQICPEILNVSRRLSVVRLVRNTSAMTLDQIGLIIVGAVLGAIFAPWYAAATRAATRQVRRATLRRRAKDGVASSLSSKIVSYYRARSLESSLYCPQFIGSHAPIALLYAQDLEFPMSVATKSDSLFSCDHILTKFPASNRILRWYRRGGVRLFDGEFMWLKFAHLDGRRLAALDVGRVNFYAYATLCFRLQREISSRWHAPRLHDRYLATFDTALASDLRPEAVGCMVATLLHGDDGLYVAVASRSTEVLNGPSTRSLLPVFGMECNAIGGRASEYGLTFYNFVREFCEEFFDLEELVHMMASRRADPDWIFQLPSAAAVVHEAVAHRLRLRRTGFGINPNDGILNCALVAHFTSRRFFKWLRAECRVNWESASGSASSAPVEFVRLDDSRLDQWADQQEIDPSSVFALDMARKYVAEMPRDPTLPTGRRSQTPC
jgi:hypothetical protein